jgi:ribosomal protein L5
MLQYIDNVLAPFDCFTKFNLRSSLHKASLEKLIISTTDLKQKNEIDYAITLLFNNLQLGSSFSLYKNLKKSVSKFKTRKGELASTVSILRGINMYSFLEVALRYQLYAYVISLKKGKIDINSDYNINISFPDVKYLFYFKNSVIHNLVYTLGFDISASIKLPVALRQFRVKYTPIYLSAFVIKKYETREYGDYI